MLHGAPTCEQLVRERILGIQYPGEEGQVLHGAEPTCEQLVRERGTILCIQYPGEEGEVLHGAPTCEQLVRERARYLVSNILVKRARCSTELLPMNSW